MARWLTCEIEPMTLANIRENGVRSLFVSCWNCCHRAIMSADPWPDHVPVPTFGPRMARRRLAVYTISSNESGDGSRANSFDNNSADTLVVRSRM